MAGDSRTRRTGLLKHKRLDPGQGLWIVPCEAVHTFGMTFPIDVLFLSRSKKILKIRPGMMRRKIAICLRAHSVLECRPALCSRLEHFRAISWNSRVIPFTFRRSEA